MLSANIRAPGSPILNSNNKVTSITFAMKDFIHSGNEFFLYLGGPEYACPGPRGEEAVSFTLLFGFLLIPRESPSHVRGCKPSPSVSRTRGVGDHLAVPLRVFLKPAQF